MLLKVSHQTIYSYPSEARDSHNELRLAPSTDEHQVCHSHEIQVDPFARADSYQGPGGIIHTFNVRPGHRRLQITLSAVVETRLTNPFSLTEGVLSDWSWYDPQKMHRLHAERLAEGHYVRLSAGAHALAKSIRADHGSGPLEFILGVKNRLAEVIDYDTDVTHVHTDSDEVLKLGQGVCQDFAHVMLAVLRTQGIPCRYVSGYIYNGEHDHLRGDQAMHAWVDVLLPGGSWLGVDPTNNILASDHHVRVHHGADYSEVTPTKGIYWGAPSGPPEVKVSISQSRQENGSSWLQQSQTASGSWQEMRPGFA